MKTFREQLRHADFVVTASLLLHAETSADELERQLGALNGHVDAVVAGDNSTAEGHLSPLAAATIALRHDVDCVVELSCRDRNRVALHGEVLGAAAAGVTSLLLFRGDDIPEEARKVTQGVFEMKISQLIRLARAVGDNRALMAAPGFVVGTRVRAFRPGEQWQAKRVTRKIDAGASFLVTQPCLNAESCRRYAARLVGNRVSHRASLIVEVPIITAEATVTGLLARLGGGALSKPVLRSIVDAPDPVDAGIAAAATMLADLRDMPGVAGANLRFDRKPEDVVAVIARTP
ncbi:MAG: methylenetetrahydrofolate reductase [Woeseiaceae bacterium]|nr:methylenetetrahydrofolate reductase [Woeseiaceae bacterium]